MLIGGHVSIAGGIEKAPERGHAIGANVIQIFASSPRSFKSSSYAAEQFVQFRQQAKEYGIERTYLHGVYLLLLASQDADYARACQDSLCQYLDISQKIGGTGVIFHIGSAVGLDFSEVAPIVSASCKSILESSPEEQLLIVENSAGDNRGIGSTIEHLTQIYEQVGSERLRFCIDTQHAFAAGNDLRSSEGIDTFIEAFSRDIGWDKVAAIHCNDSKTDLGSGVDRHENIGKGKIGLEAFRLLVNHPKFAELPFILEVPGADYKSGPDAHNVNLVKSLVRK